MISKKIILALAVVGAVSIATPARAWTLVPGAPDPVTWAAHAVFGFGVAYVLDTYFDVQPAAGVGIATGVGYVKELSDINFSYPDMIFWGAGAALYYYQKDMVRCPEIVSELYRDDWYTVYRVKDLKDCPN